MAKSKAEAKSDPDRVDVQVVALVTFTVSVVVQDDPGGMEEEAQVRVDELLQGIGGEVASFEDSSCSLWNDEEG